MYHCNLGLHFSFQVVICLVTTFNTPPELQLRMPMVTTKLVELLCYMPIEGVLPPLVFNLMVILVCSLLAFKARGLPSNFNESRYIFLCVCATVFLWFAFLPAYFTSFYATQRASSMALALILNAYVVLVCLFVPKVYAVFYVEEDKLKLTLGPGNTPGTMLTTSRVSPYAQGPTTSGHI